MGVQITPVDAPRAGEPRETGQHVDVIAKTHEHDSARQATGMYVPLDLVPVRASVNTATSAMLEAGGMKSGADVVQIKAAKAG